MERSSPLSWLGAMPVIFVGIWSTGFIVARYGMPNSPPFAFLWLRFAFSILCFLPWIWISKVPWPSDKKQWLHLGVTGIFLQTGYLGGVWSAVKGGMGSGLSALIVGLQPVLTAIWLSSQGGQVTRRQWLGLLLGFVGLSMVVSHKLEGGIEVTPLSLSMAFIALAAITIGTLYQKQFAVFIVNKHADIFVITVFVCYISLRHGSLQFFEVLPHIFFKLFVVVYRYIIGHS